MTDYDNIPSSHWKHAEPLASGINRHRIPSRELIRAIRSADERIQKRRWRFNLAHRIALIYDLFLGRDDPKPLLVERSKPDVQRAAE